MYDPTPPAPRKPSKTDFQVDVDGIGPFIFGFRKMQDQIDIEIEIARITRGTEPTPWLRAMSEWLATLRILMVQAPNGFDLDELDPLEMEDYNRVSNVFRALRDKEDSFRLDKKAARAGGGAGAVANGGVLVSPQVQPEPQGSTVP